MSDQDPASPCIGVCMVNPDNNLCEGCYRKPEEIEGWWDYSPEEKRRVLARLETRIEQIIDGVYQPD